MKLGVEVGVEEDPRADSARAKGQCSVEVGDFRGRLAIAKILVRRQKVKDGYHLAYGELARSIAPRKVSALKGENQGVVINQEDELHTAGHIRT